MIEVQNLCRRIRKQEAVRNVTLLFRNGSEQGNVYALLGPAGAGKTTLLELIAGCIEPDAGNILISGYDIARNPREAKRQIGYMPQGMRLPEDATVWEYLSFIAEAKRIPDEQAILRTAGVCERVGIGGVRDSRISGLAAPVRARVLLAQALLGDPEYLLLDQPADGLDSVQTAVLYRLIRTLSAGKTVLVTGDLNSGLQEYADRIIVLNQGTVVAEEQAESLFHSQAVAQAAENRILHLTAKGDAPGITELLRGIEGVQEITLLESGSGQVSLRVSLAPGNMNGEQTDDVRDEIFFAMAEKRYALLSMEMQKQSPEDVLHALIKEDEA